jgi:hypothetical protein
MLGISIRRATAGFSTNLLHTDIIAVTWLNVVFTHDPATGSDVSSSHILTYH